MSSGTRTSFSEVFIICLFLPHLSLSSSPIYYSENATNCTNTSNRTIEYVQCLNDIPAWESCPDPTLCEPQTGNNVGLAFGLTIGAGLATTLGALLPFIPFIKRSNTTFLAVGLALAAGVMLYVSFTEILKKSSDNFCCATPDHYTVASTGCFFGGIFLTILLDLLVTLLQRLDCGCTCTVSCTSRCESKDLENTDVISSSKVKSSLKDKTFYHSRSGKRKLSGMNGLHKEIDFVHYYSEGGHTPMVASSSEISTASDPTADSPEEGEEPGEMVTIETNNNNLETESTVNPLPPCNSQRAVLLGNDLDSMGSATDSAADMTRHNSISDTESRRHAAITPDVASTTLSENTNNYGNASVNELFSNSSLLRMNAVIQPETVNGSVASGDGEDGVGVVVTDSKSHVSVTIDESCDGGEGVTVVDRESEKKKKKTGARKLLRRKSYSEMVEQKHDDIVEPVGPEEFKEVTMVMGKDARRLHRMGILTGLAIAIHNFPEGLATFVAALSSPSLGIALAIAIALHNIPEGVCVSMPVYYATGKKWKGFLWAFLSGISEPFGALLGWLVFKDLFGPLVYGCLFGFIAGMMVFISLKELLPTAHKFDKRGTLVSIFIVIGMAIMAISLLLFLY